MELGGGRLKAVFCAGCGRRTSADEVALNQKLLGVQIGRFFCIRCLAARLDTTTEYLQKMIVHFKEKGCTYFARLMEDSSDE